MVLVSTVFFVCVCLKAVRITVNVFQTLCVPRITASMEDYKKRRPFLLSGPLADSRLPSWSLTSMSNVPPRRMFMLTNLCFCVAANPGRHTVSTIKLLLHQLFTPAQHLRTACHGFKLWKAHCASPKRAMGRRQPR